MRAILSSSLPRLAHVSYRTSPAVSRVADFSSSKLVVTPAAVPVARRSSSSPSTSSSATSFSSTRAFAAAATTMASSSSALPPLSCDEIICLGKNYVEHQKEMGGPAISMPVIFLKPASCAVFAKKKQAGEGEGEGENSLPLAVVRVPRDRGSCHYETELVLRVGADGRSFDAVTIGLDLTLRDVQNECKKTGHPWESAKVFRGAAVLGDWVPLPASAPPSSYLDLPFELDLAEEALRYVTSLFEVCPGDFLFTGTPAGVGPVLPGQEAEVRLLKGKGEGAEALVRYQVRFE